jgi:hypothetical protein
VKNKSGWVYGSKGRRSSERDADAYAISKVREWRKRNIAKEAEEALRSASLILSSTVSVAIMIFWLLTTTFKRRIAISP